jgi:hypothetical protein
MKRSKTTKYYKTAEDIKKVMLPPNFADKIADFFLSYYDALNNKQEHLYIYSYSEASTFTEEKTPATLCVLLKRHNKTLKPPQSWSIHELPEQSFTGTKFSVYDWAVYGFVPVYKITNLIQRLKRNHPSIEMLFCDPNTNLAVLFKDF